MKRKEGVERVTYTCIVTMAWPVQGEWEMGDGVAMFFGHWVSTYILKKER